MEQENDELELSTWKNIENSAKKVSINLTQTCIKVI